MGLSAQEIEKMPDRHSSISIKKTHDFFQEYDSIKGNPTRIVEKSYGRAKKRRYSTFKLSKWKTIYFFSKNNLIERKTNYYKGEKRGDWLYKYDEKRNKISEMTIYGVDKGKASKNKIRYDSLGRIESIKVYYTTNEISFIKTDFIYSINGDTVSYKNIQPIYRKKDTIFSRVVEIFDSLNRIIERRYFDSDELLKTKWNFYYDKYGNLESFNSQFKDSEETEFSIIDWRIFEYKYDHYGNWVLKYQLVDKKRIPLARREIEY